MTRPMTSIPTIASKLRDSEREALLSLPPLGSYADAFTTPPWPSIHMRAQLGDLGQMRPRAVFNHGFGITPLGEQVREFVRTHLEKEASK